MRLKEFEIALENCQKIEIELPEGRPVPSHFHITEIGKVKHHFIDCGGKERMEEKISFQLWVADDFDHELKPEKLLSIISLGKEKLALQNQEIEVEFQGETIGKYGLSFTNGKFVLTNTKTACLALEKCGFPSEKPKLKLSALKNAETNCTPGGGCC